MSSLLTLFALAVLLLMITSISRALRREQTDRTVAERLSLAVTVFLVIFAAVSLSAVSQLAIASTTAEFVLVLFLAANAFLVKLVWGQGSEAVTERTSAE